MFYNTRYTDLIKAADKPDGLTILGVFFEVSRFKTEVRHDRCLTRAELVQRGTSHPLRK